MKSYVYVLLFKKCTIQKFTRICDCGNETQKMRNRIKVDSNVWNERLSMCVYFFYCDNDVCLIVTRIVFFLIHVLLVIVVLVSYIEL